MKKWGFFDIFISEQCILVLKTNVGRSITKIKITIINTKHISLEMNWINQGTKYFKYDTSGFLDIYNDFKRICGI